MGNCQTSEEYIETEYDLFQKHMEDPKRIFKGQTANCNEYLFKRQEMVNGENLFIFYLVGEDGSPSFFAKSVGGMAITKGQVQFSNKIEMKQVKPGVFIPVSIQGYSFHSYWIPFAYVSERMQFNQILCDRMYNQQKFIIEQIKGDSIRTKKLKNKKYKKY